MAVEYVKDSNDEDEDGRLFVDKVTVTSHTVPAPSAPPPQPPKEYPVLSEVPLSKVYDKLLDSKNVCAMFESVRSEKEDPQGLQLTLYKCKVICTDAEAKDFNMASDKTLQIILQKDQETGNDVGMHGCVTILDRCDNDSDVFNTGAMLAYVDEVAEKLLENLERQVRPVYVEIDAEWYELTNVRALYIVNRVD